MTANPRADQAGWTRALCWATVTLEGFDIVALSAALPSILDAGHAGIGKAEATFVTTLSLVGILVGAVAVGPLSDRFGRKVCMLSSIALFSVLTLLVPLAPDVTTFGTLRFLAGIGLVVLVWWTIGLDQGVPGWAVLAAVALVAAHLAALLASYGPPAMPLDAATLRRWVPRGAVVLLVVPATFAAVRVLHGEPEQPGIWLLGVTAACVATVVATIALGSGGGQR